MTVESGHVALCRTGEWEERYPFADKTDPSECHDCERVRAVHAVARSLLLDEGIVRAVTARFTEIGGAWDNFTDPEGNESISIRSDEEIVRLILGFASETD